MKCNPSFDVNISNFMFYHFDKSCEQIGEIILDLMKKAMDGDRTSLYSTGYIRHLVMRRGRPSIPKHLRVLIRARDGGKCVMCESVERIQIDHIKPVSIGGESIEENLQVLCARCNRKKGPQSWTRK